jgi:hypothetical protein|uniref:Uncharacterized protein n=1 Tax=Arabidopsis thaliana TaxID=3702 RepID=Q1G3S3_ARATH|nr:unknown protein [Arabidopsis thaliana]
MSAKQKFMKLLTKVYSLYKRLINELLEKFISFEERYNTQLAALTASCSKITSAHNTYADRVDTFTPRTLRTSRSRGRLEFLRPYPPDPLSFSNYVLQGLSSQSVTGGSSQQPPTAQIPTTSVGFNASITHYSKH